jgi:hypothetical protein
MTDYKPFLLIIILATMLMLSQLFVYPDYRPAPINLSALRHRAEIGTNPNNNLDAARVVCQPECWFNIGDKQIPARMAHDTNGQLSELKLHFVDVNRGLIGYDNASESNPEFYVFNFDKELLQFIQLDLNHRRRLEFVEYYPDTKQMLFSSSDGSQWLYSAVSPDLRKI